MMTLNISAWAIRRPIPSLLLVVPLFAIGVVSFQRLPVADMPNVDVPRVLVRVARVDRIGGVDREILVSLDPDRLLALGITASEINDQVRAVNVDLAGGRGELGEIFSGFEMAMAAGIVMAFAVLILLFSDVPQPVTILVSLPLSVGGALIALLLTGNPIDLSVVIGFLMLMGIVTKNAILLVDFAVREMAGGMERTAALLLAGGKRAKPIIMTTVAMSVGMLPSALGTRDGGEFRAPMAIAVIGGLIASTLLSLVFVPVMFTVMDDLRLIPRRHAARVIGPGEDAKGRCVGAPPPL